MPAWEDITPYTESRTRSRRFSWTNLLILLNLSGFIASGFLQSRAEVLALFEFDAAEAIGRFHLWQFLSFSFVQIIDPRFIPWLILGVYTLYTLGNELENEIGSGRFLAIYFAGGAYGAASHAILQTFLPYVAPSFETLRTSSLAAPVLAVATAAMLRSPRRPVLLLFFIPLPLRAALLLLGAGWALCAVFAFPSQIGPSLGAMLAAASILALEPRLDQFFERAGQRRERNLFLEEVDIRRRTDLLLDKISREGLASLSRGEKRILLQASALLRKGKGRSRD